MMCSAQIVKCMVLYCSDLQLFKVDNQEELVMLVCNTSAMVTVPRDLQVSMCDAAKNGDLALQQIFDLMDVDLLMKEVASFLFIIFDVNDICIHDIEAVSYITNMIDDCWLINTRTFFK